MRICYLPNIDGDIDQIECYNPNEFDYHKLSNIAIKSNRKYSPSAYMANICTFDIETTTIKGEDPYAFMYHWQVCIDGHVIYGRYWQEFIDFLENVHTYFKLSDSRKLVIYVHNLGFEYQHFKQFLRREYGELKLFSSQPRKPIKVSCDAGFEFRCSWKLSNMSLEKFCKSQKGVRHLKQKGDLDYKIIRTPQTLLTDKEFAYCIGDVVGLYEAIKSALIHEGDNLESIPLTSTGYVRRDCRNSVRKEKGYRKLFVDNKMTPGVYTLLKQASRGGDTHASRRLAGRLIADVDSYDVQSSYPAMLCMRKYPMSQFVPYGDIEDLEELDTLLNTKACLFKMTITGVCMKDYFAMPYLSESKCNKLVKPICDNGRVLSAEGLEITVTDIDYKLIDKQYTWDAIYITEMHVANYGYLPESLLDVVRYYFNQKSKLKVQKKQIEKLLEKESTPELLAEYADICYYYDRSKNRLNGIFGMCFTDPVHDIIEELEDGTWKVDRPDIQKALDKYYKSRNSFLVYAWGVWTTAHARAHLARLVDLIGQNNTIYGDTDSDKGYNINHDIIEAENQNIMQEAIARNAYCEVDGYTFYMGIYERETKTPYEKFITLGAKKYAYVDKGELHVTISGVNKEHGAIELSSIDNFKQGFIFTDAGGKELVYNESPIKTITVNGCTFETASNVAMLDSTYTLGIQPEYADIIGIPFVHREKVKRRKKEMKRPETSNQKKSNQNYLENVTFSVKAVRCFAKQNGPDDVVFDMELNGVTIYGCRVVEGKNGDFISFPSRKGSDGKYYSIAYAPLDSDTQNTILKEVERRLNE